MKKLRKPLLLLLIGLMLLGACLTSSAAAPTSKCRCGAWVTAETDMPMTFCDRCGYIYSYTCPYCRYHWSVHKYH